MKLLLTHMILWLANSICFGAEPITVLVIAPQQLRWSGPQPTTEAAGVAQSSALKIERLGKEASRNLRAAFSKRVVVFGIDVFALSQSLR